MTSLTKKLGLEQPIASLHRTKQNGREVYRVAFYCRMGAKKKRRFIRLGELNRKDAEGIARRVKSSPTALTPARAPTPSCPLGSRKSAWTCGTSWQTCA